MVGYLNSLPNGTLILLAVSDEAGITYSEFGACGAQGWEPAPALRLLGAVKINDYCFRDSWSMITVKGVGQKDEQIAHTTPAKSSYTYDLP